MAGFRHSIGTLTEHMARLLQSAPLSQTHLSQTWPVGAIFISSVATNPATLIGCGTWQEFGSGRVLVGQDTGQSEFDVLEETGGAKTHTLSVNEIPAHTHTYIEPDAPVAASPAGTPISSSINTRTAGVATGSTGGGQAFSKMPPYIVVKFWRRTA